MRVPANNKKKHIPEYRLKDTTDDVVERFKERYMQPGITDVQKDSAGIKVVVATPLTALNLPSCFEGIAVRPVLAKEKEDLAHTTSLTSSSSKSFPTLSLIQPG